MKSCKHCGEKLSKNIRGLACTVCRNGMNRYGLTRNQQIKLLEKQGGKCGICRVDLTLFSNRRGGYVDHNHSNDTVRGILCHPCNTFLGYLENKGIDAKQIQFYLENSARGEMDITVAF